MARRKKNTPATINRVKAAEIMFGTGSAQHKAAIKRFGSSGGPSSPYIDSKHPRDKKGKFKRK